MGHHHVVRIAVDPQGRPISGSIECGRSRCRKEVLALDVGPFDTTEDVWRSLIDRLDRQLRLI